MKPKNRLVLSNNIIALKCTCGSILFFCFEGKYLIFIFFKYVKKQHRLKFCRKKHIEFRFKQRTEIGQYTTEGTFRCSCSEILLTQLQTNRLTTEFKALSTLGDNECIRLWFIDLFNNNIYIARSSFF